jgi:hypothetical protein
MSSAKVATPIAKYGPSGPGLALHEYLPRLEEYLEEQYGPAVYSLRTGIDCTPTPPSREAVRTTLTQDGLTGAALNAAEQAIVTENRKLYTKLALDHKALVGKAFAATINTLTTDGKEAVRSHADFPSARE